MLVWGWWKKENFLPENNNGMFWVASGMMASILGSILSGVVNDWNELLVVLMVILVGLLGLSLGSRWKSKSLQVWSMVIIGLAVLSQTAGFLLMIPWWVWLAGIGGFILWRATKQLAKKEKEEEGEKNGGETEVSGE